MRPGTTSRVGMISRTRSNTKDRLRKIGRFNRRRQNFGRRLDASRFFACFWLARICWQYNEFRVRYPSLSKDWQHGTKLRAEKPVAGRKFIPEIPLQER